MISASNASILAGSRVALSMSHRSHLPRFFGSISARTHTPYVAVLAAGGSIGLFALLLPLEDLAHFANLVLLTALCFVNAALIVHRRRFPDIERPFRVPLVPLLPALGIAANIYLILQIPMQGHLQPVLLAILALLVGLFWYAAWRGTRYEVPDAAGPQSRIVALRASPREAPFRILLPVYNPHTAEPLLRIAATLARQRDGEVTLLRVVQVPDQLPPELARKAIEAEDDTLERLAALEGELGVPITTEVRVGHNVGRAILEARREDRSHLIVLGWKGFTTQTRQILGEVTDDVVRLARADIMLVRFGPGRAVPRRILLPTAGSVHARKAAGYAAGLTEGGGGTLTLAGVVPVDVSEPKRAEKEKWLAGERAGMPAGAAVETRVLAGSGVVESIVAAADDYDAVMVGASGDSFSSRILFGTIPERIAREAPGTVMVLKSHERVRAFMGRVAAD